MIGLGVGLHTGVAIKAKALQFDGDSPSSVDITFTGDVAEVSFYLKAFDEYNQAILYFGGLFAGAKWIRYDSYQGGGKIINVSGLSNTEITVNGEVNGTFDEGDWAHIKITFNEITAAELSIANIQTNFGQFAIHSLELKNAAGVVVGKYPLNEGHGTTAYDTSGNNLTDGGLSVGDTYGGGLIYKIDTTGNNIYIAAEEDLEETYAWGCYGTDINGNNSTVSPELHGIGTGLQNTLEIVSGCSQTPIAASEALAYESEGYSDWYLPSKDELLEMYNTIGQGESNAGDFGSGYYWSSSESNSSYAWYVYFSNGNSYTNSKTNTYRVRPVRVVKGALGSTANGTINDGVWVDV